MKTNRIRDLLAQAAFWAAMVSITTAGLLALDAIVALGDEPIAVKPESITRLPAGSVTLKAPWKWPVGTPARPMQHAVLAGEGPGITYLKAFPDVIYAIGIDGGDHKTVDCEIRDLSITGSMEGIRIGENVHSLTIRNVRFERITKFAVRFNLPKTTARVRILDCAFDGPMGQGILGVCHDLEVRDCRFLGVGKSDGDHAIYLTPHSGMSFGPVTVDRCLFDGAYCTMQVGPALPDSDGGIVDFAVRNNLWRRAEKQGPANYFGGKGLVVTGNTFIDHSLFPPLAKDCIIAGNRWQISGEWCDCLGFLGEFGDVTVRGNHFHGGRFGVYLAGEGTNLTVADNLFSGQARAFWCRTREGTKPAENVAIERNRIERTVANSAAINFYDGYRPAGHQLIRGNVITGAPGLAIYATVPWDWIVEGNALAPGQTILVKRPEAKPEN